MRNASTKKGTHRTLILSTLALGSLVGITLLSSALASQNGISNPDSENSRALQSGARLNQAATSTPAMEWEWEPMESSATAIAAAYDIWPSTVTTDTHTAKLITHARFETDWLRWPTADVGDSEWDPSTGLWLVGIASSELKAPTVAASLGMTDTDTSAVDGMFVAFDANSGLMRGLGVMDAATYDTRNMTAIAVIPTASVSIGTPTP